MDIKFWGVRGSLPAPMRNIEYSKKISKILQLSIKQKIKTDDEISQFINTLPPELKYVYGGDTTCVSIISKSGKEYIIDCGSGIRPLGDSMLSGPSGKGKGEINIFLTHNHWDHIMGLPFFKPIYIKDNILNFYSPFPEQKEILMGQQIPPYFPAPFMATASTKNFIKLDDNCKEPIKLEGNLTVEYYKLNHPGSSFAYKFTENDKTFIFATDVEFTGETLEKRGNHTDFFNNSDILVLDSQYTLDESFQKISWGHTSYTMAVNCATRWKVKNLVLTHHEPGYSDEELSEIHDLALEHAENVDNSELKIYTAREGMTFKL